MNSKVISGNANPVKVVTYGSGVGGTEHLRQTVVRATLRSPSKYSLTRPCLFPDSPLSWFVDMIRIVPLPLISVSRYPAVYSPIAVAQ